MEGSNVAGHISQPRQEWTAGSSWDSSHAIELLDSGEETDGSVEGIWTWFEKTEVAGFGSN